MGVPDLAHARDILASFSLPAGIVTHSEGVRRVAVEAARLVEASGVPVGVELVAAAALLHDIDKVETRDGDGEHGVVGARRLVELGHQELAMPVASHPLQCLLDEERFPRGWPSVIVAIADKHVAQDFVTLDQRLDDMVERYPQHRASIDAARRPAHALEAELAEVSGLSVPALVERLGAAWQAGA